MPPQSGARARFATQPETPAPAGVFVWLRVPAGIGGHLDNWNSAHAYSRNFITLAD